MKKIKEFFNRIKEMNKTDKLFLKIMVCLLALNILFCILTVRLTIKNKNNAYAEYETDILNNPNAIVILNQAITEQVNYTNSTTDTKQYFQLQIVEKPSNYTIITTDINTLGKYSTIIENVEYSGEILFKHNGSIADLDIYRQNLVFDNNSKYYFSFDVLSDNPSIQNGLHIKNLILINLSLMFGSGNEPTLEQANLLFVADFYAYTTGTNVAYNTIDAYNNGVNAYLESTQFQINTLSFVNSVYSVNLDNTYQGNGIANEEYWDVLSKSSNYVTMSPHGSIIPTICLPFIYELPAGTQITINGKVSCTQYNASYYLQLGVYINGVMQNIGEMSAGSPGINYHDNTITVTLPANLDRIYIYSTDDATFNLKDFEVGYYVTNLELLRELSYKAGFDYASEYYSEDNDGYKMIYNKGLQDGTTTGKAFSDTMSFTASIFHTIGDILSMEIIPNIPLGLFVAFPLLVGLLFFIVKIAKGSGG